MRLSSSVIFLLTLFLPEFSVAQYPPGCDGTFFNVEINLNGSFSEYTCNVDPSQGNEQFLFGYSGSNCYDYPLVIQNALEYVGIEDGLDTTAIASAVTVPPTSTYLVFPPYTDLPYSSLSGLFSNLVTVTYNAGEVYTFNPIGFTQSLIQTIFTTTITFTSTDQSITTTTSTVTDQLVSSASPVTVTASSFSGIATVYASPKTTTHTRTITRPRTTSTSFSVKVVTKTLSCRPSPKPSNHPLEILGGKTSVTRFDKRDVPPNPFTTIPSDAMLDFCSQPLSSTTYYNTTVASITSGTTVETDYAMTTTTSTYTETDTVYVVQPSKTDTTTPTYTELRTTFTRHGTKTVTQQITVTETKTKHHKGAKPCKSVSS